MTRYKARWTLAALAAIVAATIAGPGGRHGTAWAGDPGGTRHLVVLAGTAPPNGFRERVTALGGSLLSVSAGLGFATVANLAPEAVTALRAMPGISAVEPDIILGPSPDETTTPSEVLSAATIDAAGDTPIQSHASPAEAAHYGLQWNLRAIHAESAWAARKFGSEQVLAAVLDTGIDYKHPDLVGRVDLERSRSLLSHDAAGNPRTGPVPCPGSEPGMPSNLPPTALPEDTVADNDPDRERFTDYHSHGTAVAALIASNAHVLAGVSQKTTLLAVKVHDRTRRNCISVYLEGVEYAANQGADVIHLSFPLEFSKEQYPGAVALVNRAMAYAHRKGAVLVAAAGNASENLDLDEDRFRFCMAIHVVCVSATGPALESEIGTDAQDDPADYTNYGEAIDVAGPGGTGTFPMKVVPVWLACSQVTLITAANQAPSQCRTAPREIWWSTGTSFGAAATSGLLALLVARIGEGKPDQVVAALRQSADDLGVEGDDPFYGKGRINVARALGLPLP